LPATRERIGYDATEASPLAEKSGFPPARPCQTRDKACADRIRHAADAGSKSARSERTIEETFWALRAHQRAVAVSPDAIARSAVLPDNISMLKVFEKSGLGCRTRQEGRTVHVTLHVPD
jgi:hypothetical protein